MSETIGAVTQTVLVNTLTVTNDYQQIFSTSINNALVQVSMKSGNLNTGSILILISSGIAKNICFTGGIGFSGSSDLYVLPLSYNVYSNDQSYTLWIDYVNGKLVVSKNEQDVPPTVTFTGFFISSSDYYENSNIAVDSFVENNVGSGITLGNKVLMNNGVINIGTSSNTNHDINIATNSSVGGRTLTLGNTISGSSIVLNGRIEMLTTAADTITYNNSGTITWTDVHSTARRIGRMCHVAIKANVSTTAALTKGTQLTFFSVYPANKYTTTYPVTGVAFDANTNEIGNVLSVATTSDFKLLLPTDLDANESTTIYASVTYISS